jgi:hypothetical protein
VSVFHGFFYHCPLTTDFILIFYFLTSRRKDFGVIIAVEKDGFRVINNLIMHNSILYS